MNCDRARRLFGACWDDELTHAEREWLEGHLAACPRCRAGYDAYSRTLELVGTLPRAEAPPDLVERVLARSRHAKVAPDALRERPARWVPALATASAVIVLALAAWFALPGAPWRGPDSGGPAWVAVGGGGPQMPEVVRASQGGVANVPAGEAARQTAAVAADDPFDHSADVEFILDPVSVTRGRATVSHAGSRQPAAEGERAIISF